MKEWMLKCFRSTFFDFLLVFQFFPVSDIWEPVQNLMIRWPQGRCACVRVKERERERERESVCVCVCSWMWHTKAFFQDLKLRAAICSLSQSFQRAFCRRMGGWGWGVLLATKERERKVKKSSLKFKTLSCSTISLFAFAQSPPTSKIPSKK